MTELASRSRRKSQASSQRSRRGSLGVRLLNEADTNTGGESIEYDPIDDVYYVSDRNQNKITKV